jgi:histidyl-tRNA synthetase
VEIIALCRDVLRDVGIDDARLALNSIGSADARAEYDIHLREYLVRPDVHGGLCEDCRRRAESNPLRVFDCKKESCAKLLANAPTIDRHLTPDDREHFAFVKSALNGLGIEFDIDLRMVRGLDYYTRTTFEFKTTRLGAQDALCGGGRYDGLVEVLGGPPTPAVGFAAGMERILAVLDAGGKSAVETTRLDVFVCALGDRARGAMSMTLSALRDLGLSAEADFQDRGLKAQMKEAGRHGARCALIFGEDELGRGRLTLRKMDLAEQSEISADTSTWNRSLFDAPV